MLHGRMVGLALLAILAAAWLGSSGAQASRWGKEYFPEVSLVSQDGKTLRFYDDLINNKVFVINFLYTTCRDICPLTASRLAELQEKLGDSVGRDIFFYSISIDPETDTPERLKQYAQTFRAGPGWLFLTGKREDIDAIRYKLGERSKFLSDHRNEVLLGNGATGEWARNSVLGDLNSLAITVRSMDPAWRRTGGKDGQFKVMDFNLASHPGQALYKRLCAGCHTVGHGDRVGPDLAGVLARRDRSWLMSYIADPHKMRVGQDAVALALAARFPAVRMPAMGVSSADVADLLSYIAHLETQHATRFPLTPLLALTTHRGQRLAPELVQGSPVAVVFGFTHCPDVCPTTLLDWSNALASLGPDGDRLKVLFVSVDSERDTPEALEAYLTSFDPRIIALTGSAAEIAAGALAFDAFYAKVADSSGGVTFDHTAKTYLVGRDGQLAGTVDLRTAEGDRGKQLARLLAQ